MLSCQYGPTSQKECFQYLVDSKPQGIKTILKAFQPNAIKMYLIKWPVSGVIVSMQAMTSSHPKVPDVQNPSHYVLGSGSGRLWLSRGAAVNNYFNFIHHLGGACEAVEQALKKSVESVKELKCFRDPQGAHLQSWRWHFSLDICNLWTIATHEPKLNTSNRKHFHPRKMRCFFFTPLWACPCFRNLALVARSTWECFSLKMLPDAIYLLCAPLLRLTFTTR